MMLRPRPFSSLRYQLPRNSHIPSRLFPICQRSRAFHATVPRKDIYSTLLSPTHGLLTLLHSTGLSWALVLPATAFLLRGALVFLGGISGEKRQQRYLALNPLREALTSVIRKEHQQGKLSKNLHPRDARGSAAPENMGQKVGPTHVRRIVWQETRNLHRRWDCQVGWTNVWRLWHLPVFISIAETLRRMMGMRGGLLGWILDPAATAAPETGELGEILSYQQRIMEADHSLNPWYVPSFAEEGMLWFPNLMLPDPYCVLPVAVSGLMILNVWVVSRFRGNLNPSKWSKRLTRMVYAISGLSLLVTPQMPAGIVFYWASSSLSALVWNFWLNSKYPSPSPPKACKRQVVVIPGKLRPQSAPYIRIAPNIKRKVASV